MYVVRWPLDDGISHVVTEMDPEGDAVTYRLQGDLAHYTEVRAVSPVHVPLIAISVTQVYGTALAGQDNLRKRAALETHPYMVALTQRLWLSAVPDGREYLTLPEYEAYMLRLHRLILPEFDVDSSKELIREDWERDANGVDHLDYRYFHLSMFELVGAYSISVRTELSVASLC